MSDDSHVLKPTKFGINDSITNKTDRFGQQYNADDDRSKWSDNSPQESRKAHSRSDVDVSSKSQHHTLGTGRNQASPGNHIHDGTTSKALALRDLGIDIGVTLVNFTTLSSFTTAIVFGKAYPTGTVPNVHCNINFSSGSTSRWEVRAFSITATGFTLWAFKTDAADPAQTWVNVPVQWTAIG